MQDYYNELKQESEPLIEINDYLKEYKCNNLLAKERDNQGIPLDHLKTNRLAKLNFTDFKETPPFMSTSTLKIDKHGLYYNGAKRD